MPGPAGPCGTTDDSANRVAGVHAGRDGCDVSDEPAIGDCEAASRAGSTIGTTSGKRGAGAAGVRKKSEGAKALSLFFRDLGEQGLRD